jgi:hypothetical protein
MEFQDTYTHNTRPNSIYSLSTIFPSPIVPLHQRFEVLSGGLNQFRVVVQLVPKPMACAADYYATIVSGDW